jgi:hypothetical protein
VNHKKDASNVMGRRQALQVVGLGLTTAGSLLGLQGCKKDEMAPAMKPADPPPAAMAPPPPAAMAAPEAAPAAAAAPPADLNCKEKAPIDDNAKDLRRALQYKEKSAEAGKNCLGCAQYQPGKYGDCGGCNLFGGAVNPGGHCLSYAPKAAKPG